MADRSATAGEDGLAPALVDEEARVIGCLVEKSMTTPDQYPLTLNSVTLAANQRSNRDPVVDYSEALVERTLRELTDRGLARMVHRPGDRVVKYKHAIDERIGVDERRASLLAVLLLRGAQTPGELRQRTQRYVEFGSLAELEDVLDALVVDGFVARLPRQPGQKEARVVELLSARGRATADGIAERPQTPAGPPEPLGNDLEELRAEVADLRGRFEALLDQLGVDDV